MDNQKFSLILEKLLERTEEGKLKWKNTANRNTYLVVLEDSSISISRNFIDDEYLGPDEFYTFDFRNGNGDIVESVDILKFIGSDKPTKEFEKAEIIYKIARNQSLKVDKIVDRILEQLAA